MLPPARGIARALCDLSDPENLPSFGEGAYRTVRGKKLSNGTGMHRIAVQLTLVASFFSYRGFAPEFLGVRR
ncbi:hypothetical protein FHS92_003109 [Sphingobium subterraneum]|uniref:Uncharacterized protein n=1 Tax=Sphingobium subterraneum TaxID=627688 RepID=A0A841J9V6_9SPHN|nr:hypothetical protein [Sphingobium subterraneum]